MLEAFSTIGWSMHAGDKKASRAGIVNLLQRIQIGFSEASKIDVQCNRR